MQRNLQWNRTSISPPHFWSVAKANSITITAKIKAMIKLLFPNERTKIKQTNPKQKTDSQCVKEKEESLKDMKISMT